MAALLAISLGACGGGDESGSTAGEATGQTESKATTSDTSPKAGEGTYSFGEGTFTPEQHIDSGGGSAQLKGDRSVLDYGEEAESSERESAALVLHDFLDARADLDWETACSFLAADTREELEDRAAQSKNLKDKSCAGILEQISGATAAMISEATYADVRSLRIKGDSGFIIFSETLPTLDAMPVVEEDGSWKISSATISRIS